MPKIVYNYKSTILVPSLEGTFQKTLVAATLSPDLDFGAENYDYLVRVITPGNFFMFKVPGKITGPFRIKINDVLYKNVNTDITVLDVNNISNVYKYKTYLCVKGSK